MRSSARLRARSCSAASASAQDTHVATSAQTACQVSLTPRRQDWAECPPSHETRCVRKPGARPTDQHEGHGAGTAGGPTSGLVLLSEGSGLSSLCQAARVMWARAVLLPTVGRCGRRGPVFAGLAARQPRLLELLPEPQPGVWLDWVSQPHRPVSPRALLLKAVLSQVPFLRRDTELSPGNPHPSRDKQKLVLGLSFRLSQHPSGDSTGRVWTLSQPSIWTLPLHWKQ